MALIYQGRLLQQPRIDYVTMLSYVARVADGMDSLSMLSFAFRVTALSTQNFKWQRLFDV
jgi:hypothetical protein